MEGILKLLNVLRLKRNKKTKLPDVQKQPLIINGKDNSPIGQIKVDAAYHINEKIVIAGWRTAKVELFLKKGGDVLSCREICTARPDVAAHFSLSKDIDVGFILIASCDQMEFIELSWSDGSQGNQIAMRLEITKVYSHQELDRSAFGNAFSLLDLGMNDEVPLESKHLPSQKMTLSQSAYPNARGHLEAASCTRDGSVGVVVGWLLCTEDTNVWLEDTEGSTYRLDNAFRMFRQDVLDAVGADVPEGNPDTGFVLRIEGIKPGAVLKLMAASTKGQQILNTAIVGELSSDPVDAAKWMFTIQTSQADQAQRFWKVDIPVIEHLIQRKQSGWTYLTDRVVRLGEAVSQPLISIIIPLYGRTDFVEHQLVEFVCDEWLQEHAEIIYVIDDPALVESFTSQAQALYRLYKIPFTWIWGSSNRGFSGANNLGAKYARAPYLNFLNSDAFPQRPSWLKELVDVLQSNEDIGVVAPRLVFADGSIQHAGMEFQRRDELGIWINHHPFMGMDPALDPYDDLTALPAVTGACMVVRKADFDAVGQWDTGYLIGDFEDSDLCLKLRKASLKVAYLPSVQLTHLERQSFKLIGQGDFRTKVVIYNAARHQGRWAELINPAVAALQ